MHYNTIILKKGQAYLTEREYKNFQKGDTIWGDGREPEELKRWNIEDEEQAKEELAKHRCTYTGGNGWQIEEYALEYCDCDSEGEFIGGSDYDLAEEEGENKMKTLSYYKGTEQEIEVGAELYFGQIWDGEDGDGSELLESGCVSPDGENVVAFEVVETAEDIMDTLVKVTDIY